MRSDWLARSPALAHEPKTQAIRQALLDRRARLQARGGKSEVHGSVRDHLERNAWPLISLAELGRVLSREEEEGILGYGPGGY